MILGRAAKPAKDSSPVPWIFRAELERDGVAPVDSHEITVVGQSKFLKAGQSLGNASGMSAAALVSGDPRAYWDAELKHGAYVTFKFSR